MQEENNHHKFENEGSPSKDHLSHNLQSIQQTRSQLDHLIGDLNNKLQTHFHSRQQQLLQQYKIQLIAAQKQLHELRSSTNQQQIRSKMTQRKRQLQKQRQKLISTNLQYSQQCQENKKKLSQLMAYGQQLDRELAFLDKQMKGAQQKKNQMMMQADMSQRKAETERYILDKEDKTTMPMQYEEKKTMSVHLQGKKGEMLVEKIERKKPQEKKLVNSLSVRNYINSQKGLKRVYGNEKRQLLEKTPLEALFEEVVEGVRQKRKIHRPMIKGEEFTQLEKRIIMEEFLQKQDVKKKIYEIIFQAKQQTNGLPKLKLQYQ